MREFFRWIKMFFKRKDIFGGSVNIDYPLSWDSMSADDFRAVCTILETDRPAPETLFLCLCSLAKIRPASVRYDSKVAKQNLVMVIGDRLYVLSPKVIQAACHQLEYILQDIGLPPSPFQNVDRKMYGMTFGQFYEADALIMRYHDTQKKKWLLEAAKVLTRQKTGSLQPWQYKGLVIWWNGCKKYLKGKYPYIFQDAGEDGVAGGEKTPADILQELLSAVNGDRPQDNEKILGTEMHSVLFSLNRIYEKNSRRH